MVAPQASSRLNSRGQWVGHCSLVQNSGIALEGDSVLLLVDRYFQYADIRCLVKVSCSIIRGID
jgi:hypothetical protein